MQGEHLDGADLIADGLHADRSWAVLDTETGKVLTARREPRLVFAAARVDTGGVPHIALPDETELDGPDNLSWDRSLNQTRVASVGRSRLGFEDRLEIDALFTHMAAKRGGPRSERSLGEWPESIGDPSREPRAVPRGLHLETATRQQHPDEPS